MKSSPAILLALLLAACGGAADQDDGQRDPNSSQRETESLAARCDLRGDAFAETPSEIHDGVPEVALTFTLAAGSRAGGVDAELRALLDELEGQGVQATFFVAADAIARLSDETVRRLRAVYSAQPSERRRHLVAPYIAGEALERAATAAAAARAALETAEQAIARRGLLRPAGAQMFRFPYGGSCEAMRAVHLGAGRSAVGWHALDRCSAGSGRCDWVALAAARVARRGGIVQLHANDATTREQLGQLISTLRDRGVSFRTLDERAAFPSYARAAARRTMVVYGAPGTLRARHVARLALPRVEAAGARVFVRAHLRFAQPQLLRVTATHGDSGALALQPDSTHFGGGQQDVYYEGQLERGSGAGRWTLSAECDSAASDGEIVSWQLVVTRPDLDSSGSDALSEPALVGRWQGERAVAGVAEASVVPTRGGAPAHAPVRVDTVEVSLRLRADAARGSDGLRVTLTHGDSGALVLPLSQARRGAADCAGARCDQQLSWRLTSLRGMSALGDYHVVVSDDGLGATPRVLTGLEVRVNGARP
ncbi:MAG: hypothetical protein KC503_29055 [Myxococcales bacterium]|nr:hypothetical protein [Myxococcales bacterium]